MNIGPLPWWMSKVVFRLLRYVHGQSHLVQGPLILARNALQHSWGQKKSLHVSISGASGTHDIYIMCLVGFEIVTSPVRKDCGLKSPESQTTAGRTRS